jgi:hypothetical protein
MRVTPGLKTEQFAYGRSAGVNVGFDEWRSNGTS